MCVDLSCGVGEVGILLLLLSVSYAISFSAPSQLQTNLLSDLLSHIEHDVLALPEGPWGSLGVKSYQNQQFDILTSVDSDEPVQSPFKLRNSKWCSVSSLTLIEYSSD